MFVIKFKNGKYYKCRDILTNKKPTQTIFKRKATRFLTKSGAISTIQYYNLNAKVELVYD